MYDARNNLSSQVVADVREFMGGKVYDTVIPRNVRVSEAPSYGKPVLVYDLKCVGSQAYLRLASEIIQREKELRAEAGQRAIAAALSPDQGGSGRNRSWRARCIEGGVMTNSGDADMADEAGRSRLGRGLAALIGDVGEEAETVERARSQRRVPIEFLRPNPRNPRRISPKPSSTSSPLRSASAASSSRSWCARCAAPPTPSRSSPASGAGAPRSAPACTTCRSSRSRPRREALELAIIENVQRADLNPLEEATGYQALADEFSYSQDEIAKIVGKSRSHVANTLRLLKLPQA